MLELQHRTDCKADQIDELRSVRRWPRFVRIDAALGGRKYGIRPTSATSMGTTRGPCLTPHNSSIDHHCRGAWSTPHGSRWLFSASDSSSFSLLLFHYTHHTCIQQHTHTHKHAYTPPPLHTRTHAHMQNREITPTHTSQRILRDALFVGDNQLALVRVEAHRRGNLVTTAEELLVIQV